MKGRLLIIYKEYMLRCEIWEPIDGVWKENVLYFDTEKDMKDYIESRKKGIRVEAMFKLTKLIGVYYMTLMLLL